MQQVFSDTTSKTDRLNRLPFAKGIARTLFHATPDQNESFVFGLNGRWGSGKSTLLNFVVKEIRQLHAANNNDRYEIFEFNPWMFSGQEQLLWSFYRTLLRKIEQDDGAFRKRAKQFTDWLDNSKLGKTIGSIGGDYSDKLKKGLQNILGEGALEDVKEKLDKALVEENIRLYIIMDDLDRLTPEEITQVFQLVKLNANFKNTVFLLAYDKEIVVNAVEQKFKDNGERYLAKIVQVDYSLPEMLEEEVEHIFFDQLNIFFKRFDIFYQTKDLRLYWSKYGLKNYFRTLRDVYRYINGMAFRLPDIHKEINITHFLVLEAFRIFDYEGYQQLYWECNESMRRYQKFPYFKEEDWFLKLKNPTTLELIRTLREPSKADLDEYLFEKGRDLFHPDFFERYFTLRISEKDLPTDDFRRFLNDPENGINRLEAVLNAGRMDALLKRLALPRLQDEYHKVRVEPIRNLIRFFDEHHNRDHTYWLGVEYMALIFINFLIFSKENPEVVNQLWEELWIELTYPNYTRFILLNEVRAKLENKQLVRFQQEKDLIDDFQSRKPRIKEILNNFVLKNAAVVSVHEFKEDEWSFVSAYLDVFAELEPAIYPDFIKKRFTDPEQMALLISKTLDYEGINNFSWNAEAVKVLLPVLVRNHLHEHLNVFMGQVGAGVKPMLSEWRMKEVRFFITAFDNGTIPT